MAVNQFHLGKNGVEECHADPSKENARGCPFESDGHYDNPQQAEGALAFKMMQAGNTGTMKKKKAPVSFDLTKNSEVLKNIAHVEKRMRNLEKDYEERDEKVSKTSKDYYIASRENKVNPNPENQEKADRTFIAFDKEYLAKKAIEEEYHAAEREILDLKARIKENNTNSGNHENNYAVFDFSEFDETKVQTLSTRSFTGLRGIDFEFHDGYGKVKKVSEIKNVYVDDYKDSDPDYDASDDIFAKEGRFSLISEVELEFGDESYIDARLIISETGSAHIENEVRDGRSSIPLELHKFEPLLKKLGVKIIED